MSKLEFNDLIVKGSSDTTNINPQTHAQAYTYLGGTDPYASVTGSIGHTNYLNGTNTSYLINIPDGEVTFEELNITMNTLSNAVVHMQTKIKDLEKKKESEKINKRNIFKK